MFALDSSRRYFMCQQPVNMRKGIDALFNLIQSESPLSPMTGDVFVFFSKNSRGSIRPRVTMSCRGRRSPSSCRG